MDRGLSKCGYVGWLPSLPIPLGRRSEGRSKVYCLFLFCEAVPNLFPNGTTPKEAFFHGRGKGNKKRRSKNKKNKKKGARRRRNFKEIPEVN